MTARRTLAYPKKGGTFYTYAASRTNAGQKLLKFQPKILWLDTCIDQYLRDLLRARRLGNYRLTQAL